MIIRVYYIANAEVIFQNIKGALDSKIEQKHNIVSWKWRRGQNPTQESHEIWNRYGVYKNSYRINFINN